MPMKRMEQITHGLLHDHDHDDDGADGICQENFNGTTLVYNFMAITSAVFKLMFVDGWVCR
jgi:hypothetical protein